MRRAAFTLLELLTVIAIIGLLAGILIPTTAAARITAQRARTKVRFGQWAAAMELFRQEYGYFPAVDAGTGKLDAARFAGAVTGRTVDGSAPAPSEALGGHYRQAVFYAIGEEEMNAAKDALVDAFGNTDIGVLYDHDGDGRITETDGPARPVRADGGEPLSPISDALDLHVGINAGVIFYSAGRGSQPEDLVLSWR